MDDEEAYLQLGKFLDEICQLKQIDPKKNLKGELRETPRQVHIKKCEQKWGNKTADKTTEGKVQN